MPNPRAVIEVNLRDDAKTLEFRVTEAFDAPTRRIASALRCKPDDEVFAMSRSGGARADPAAVEAAGKRLYAALTRNKDAERLFAVCSQLPAPGAPPVTFPLLIQIDAPDAERLPWEVLWSAPPGDFFALHPSRQWPIARMVAGHTRQATLTRTAGAALRVAVVVGATGEDGTAEWAALRPAIAALGIPVELLAVVSQDETGAAIEEDLRAWRAAVPGAPPRDGTVVSVADRGELMRALHGFAPNIVHLFCHGVADPRPRLEVETFLDREKTAASGSIRLEAATLNELARAASVWLFVLNCCEGARPATNLHSLARELVAAGAPAVVAMRESVDVVDANLFTTQFYAALLPKLAGELTAPGLRDAGTAGRPVPDMLWAGALFDARQALSVAPNRDPTSSPEWSYPVLYVNRSDLHLAYAEPRTPAARPPGPADPARQALCGMLDLLVQFRAPMLASPARPEAAVAELTRQIVAIRDQLGLPREPAP